MPQAPREALHSRTKVQSRMPPEVSPGEADSSAGRSWRERLLPTFFREHPQQLYACHHFPMSSSSDSDAVLICGATGHEYERCHRAMRQLAVQLARAGHHAMRFDYYGTGDSAGEYVEGSLARWHSDIGDAIDECRRLAGRERVTVVGLRLGATLAAQAVATRDDVRNLVLYAPVMDAQSLLADWKDAQAKHDRVHGHPATGALLSEVLGFPLTDAFCGELHNGLVIPPPRPSLHRALVLFESDGEARTSRIADILASSGAAVRVETADAPAIWRRQPMEAIVPFKLIRRVVSWMKEAQA